MAQSPPRMEYVEYDPAYTCAFDQLTQSIHSVLPGTRIEHVGSTALRGLGGRETLDVVLISPPADHARIVSALTSIGFVEAPFGAARPALTHAVHLDSREYGVLLYVLPEEHELVRGWLAFRDFMRQHPDELERYAAIKKAAIAEGKTQPWTYQQAKTPYLVELAQRKRTRISHSGATVLPHVIRFQVADSLARAEKLGGRTEVPPTDIAEFDLTFAFFADPEGHVVGLSKGVLG